jgi:hypothetical protein
MCYLTQVEYQACGCRHTIVGVTEIPTCRWRASLGRANRPPGKHVYWVKEGASVPGYCYSCKVKLANDELDEEGISIDKLAKGERETVYMRNLRKDYQKRRAVEQEEWARLAAVEQAADDRAMYSEDE